MQAQIQTVRSVDCDCGNHRFTVEHILADTDKQYGPIFNTAWTCPQCGQNWKLSFDIPGQTVDMEKNGEPIMMHVLLRQKSTIDPVYFILKNPYCSKDNHDEEVAAPGTSGLAYYYDEHTCPTNWLRGIEVIVANGQPDPHGLWEFVRAVPDSVFKKTVEEHFPDFNPSTNDDEQVYAMIFPEAFQKSNFKFRIDHCRNGELFLTLTEHSHPLDIERGKEFRNELIGEALKIVDQTQAKKGMLDLLGNAPGSASNKPN